jgi:Zn-dependent peptidase ImmA (M78 family)
LTNVLDPSLLGDVSPDELSSHSGIPVERLQRLLAREASPTIFELGEIADALSVNPMYLIRARPAVAAQRGSGFENADLGDLLVAFDLHVAAYSKELGQPAPIGFPTNSAKGARTSGETWAARYLIRSFDITSPDPLIQSIEETLRIPVLIWPVPQGPFGATVYLDGTLAIWINSAGVPGSQQRFTLAHELGHIMLRHVEATRVEPDTTPDLAATTGSPARQTAEQHASAFAGGVLCDYDRLIVAWDGEISPVSVARVAAHLGISYEASIVALKTHLRRKVSGIDQSARQWSVSRAFEAAQLGETFELFQAQRNRRRVPGNLDRGDVLEMVLDARVSG